MMLLAMENREICMSCFATNQHFIKRKEAITPSPLVCTLYACCEIVDNFERPLMERLVIHSFILVDVGSVSKYSCFPNSVPTVAQLAQL